MSYPTQYYVVVSPDVFAQVHSLLKGRTVKRIPEEVKAEIDELLAEQGRWTNDNQFKHNEYHPFIYWTIEGKDRVVVEANE